MKKTSGVALVLLVLAVSHFRVSLGNKEIASKSCVCITVGMITWWGISENMPESSFTETAFIQLQIS